MGQTEFITQAFSALCFLAAGLVFAGRVYSSIVLSSPSNSIDIQAGRDRAAQRSITARLQLSTPSAPDEYSSPVTELTSAEAAQAGVQTNPLPVFKQRQGLGSVLPIAQLAVSTVQLTKADRASVTADTAIVDLSDRRVYLYTGEQLLVDYPIAIGRQHWETPTGQFDVIEKQENPVWQHPFTRELVPPGPTNPLGTHWVGFWTNGTHQIGFHGTNNTEAIGQAISHGCIRMHNADVQMLYALMPLGATVTVRL